MSVFKFKQFDVDQTGCAMKINTDGVLLGALADANVPKSILDIGAGTGVIAMMLAQRYTNALIDAVEIDETASKTAECNFKSSKFAERLHMHPQSFEDYFEMNPDVKYHLIVSNPPFFLNSLLSPGPKKSLARHTDESFFERLLNACANHLADGGTAQFILPVGTAEIVTSYSAKFGLCLYKRINIRSFSHDEPHRELIILGKEQKKLIVEDFVIYESLKIYSAAYQNALKDFFTIF
ncbi:methyltransferase [Mucilaginibacter pallidiroseus]|uniref:tRNA1(Val) (adenine(37)-N6)-methyltransferase n=1 Tax=Mucilaginibacter pallidiroseus TaxID=2599295 RepID=A0A563UIS2_9SPHI|nr:methyltransferase [Mucilaginibacter pallidiroseus]TWR31199.1 methyltransferase [Mucilaginibacter pallidiroseus]